MCYNCGCHIPQDDMGNPQNITNSTFEKLASLRQVSIEEIKKLVYDYLVEEKTDDIQLEEMFANAATSWNQSLEEARKETLKLLKTQIPS